MEAWIHPSLHQRFRLLVVWGYFFGCFGCLPIDHHLNATTYLSIIADHVHLFTTAVYPSSDGYLQHDHAPCHRAQLIFNWFLEPDTLQSPELNPIEHLLGVLEWEIHIMGEQYGPKYLSTLINPCQRIEAVLKAKGA